MWLKLLNFGLLHFNFQPGIDLAALRVPSFAYKGPSGRLSDQPANDDATAVTRDNEVSLKDKLLRCISEIF